MRLFPSPGTIAMYYVPQLIELLVFSCAPIAGKHVMGAECTVLTIMNGCRIGARCTAIISWYVRSALIISRATRT